MGGLPTEEQDLLKHRCNLEDLPESFSICLHHKCLLIDLYSTRLKQCCNPYGAHKVPGRKSLRIISIKQANEINGIIGGHSVKAGMKLCPTCRKINIERGEKYKKEHAETNISVDSDYQTKNEVGDKINESLSSMNMSPCKVSKLSRKRRLAYCKRKVKAIKKRAEEMLSTCAQISPKSIRNPNNAESDLQYLVSALKKKLQSRLERRKYHS